MSDFPADPPASVNVTQSVPTPANQPEDLDMDHEVFAGEEILDPWADKDQKDWGNHSAMLDADDDADDDSEEPV